MCERNTAGKPAAKDATTDHAAHLRHSIRRARIVYEHTTRALPPYGTPAQFCVSGFSAVHRKPVQFFGVK